MSEMITLKKGESATVASKTYSYEEVLTACIDYFGGDELAATTWMNKYAVKDSKGNYFELTPDDMHRRMAREFGRMERMFAERHPLNGSAKSLSEYGQQRDLLDEEKIFQLFRHFNYVIPQGSVMGVLGNPTM